MSSNNNFELAQKLQNLKTQNQILKGQLEELTQGGIKILFSGKANAQRIARLVKPRTLREIASLSVGNEEQKNKNLVIEGDNLIAMATLYQYHGKIDLIIADPPYNTGKDFRYNDKWDEEPNDPGLGDYVKADDPSRHTKWMKFMLPRLQLMREMLKMSGVLAICIDYRELAKLILLLDEVFGESNRIAIINWEKATVKNDAQHVSNVSEYVLIYGKNKNLSTTKLLPRLAHLDERYKNPDNDPNGRWVADNPAAKTPSRTLVYGIQNPFTGKIVYPPAASHWRLGIPTMKAMLEEYGSEYEVKDLEDGYISGLVLKNSDLKKARKKAKSILNSGKAWPKLVFRRNGLGKPGIKRYLKDIKQGSVATTYWKLIEWEGSLSLTSAETGLSQTATREIVARIGQEGKFDGIKPLKFFQKIIQLWCPSNGLVLDPFAGSGTTGEAVLQLNKENEVNRKFMLIETGNPENQDNYCRTLLQKRLQAVITGKWADKKEHEPLGEGFTFYSLNKTIDAQTLLEMKRDDLIDAILASQMENQWTRIENYQYLIAKNAENEGIFLIWNGNNKSQLTEKIYYQIVEEAKKIGLSTEKYIIYARLCSFHTENIEFKQIPSEILTSFRIKE